MNLTTDCDCNSTNIFVERFTGIHAVLTFGIVWAVVSGTLLFIFFCRASSKGFDQITDNYIATNNDQYKEMMNNINVIQMKDLTVDVSDDSYQNRKIPISSLESHKLDKNYYASI